MKKVFICLAILFLVLQSCTAEDISTEEELYVSEIALEDVELNSSAVSALKGATEEESDADIE